MLAILILTGIVAAISLYDYFSTRSWQAVTSPVRNNAVFEKRNQNYGAYKIRRDYNRNFILILLGLVGGVGVIYGAATAFREPAKKAAYVPPKTTDTFELVLTDEKLPEIELPEVEIATAPPVQEMIEFREVKVTDIETKDPITPPDPGKVIGNQQQTGTDPFGKPIFVDPNLPPGTGEPAKKKDDDENKVYSSGGLTEVAEFVGGSPERFKFMQSNFRYPDSAIEGNKEGKVYINFIVRKSGNVEEEKIVKKLNGCPECDAEALRVVKKMPPWNPGKVNGKAVDSYFNLPVTFQLARE